MSPFVSLEAFNVKDAVAIAPDAVSDSVPSVAPPSLKVKVPMGAELPLAGVTVAVSWESPFAGMLKGLAAMAVVVAMLAGVTVTVAEALEFVKVPVPVKLAEMVLPPTTRLPALSVNEATDCEPEGVNVPDPSVALPSLNVTVPVGAEFHEAGVTAAVYRVVPVLVMVAGLAVRTVVVRTVDGVTVTVADAVEFT